MNVINFLHFLMTHCIRNTKADIFNNFLQSISQI